MRDCADAAVRRAQRQQVAAGTTLVAPLASLVMSYLGHTEWLMFVDPVPFVQPTTHTRRVAKKRKSSRKTQETSTRQASTKRARASRKRET